MLDYIDDADLLSRLLEHGDPNGLFEIGKLGKIFPGRLATYRLLWPI
jgi:hypothetical protein